MSSQYENVHPGPLPYLADPNDPQSLYWENVVQESATARVYVLTTGAYNFCRSHRYRRRF